MFRLTSTLVALLALFALGLSAHTRQSESATDPFLAFAIQLDQEMNAHNSNLFDERFDTAAMIAVASKGIESEAAFHEEFIAEVRGGLNVGEQIVQTLANYDGTYHFLRMLPTHPPRALFRLASDDGLNYHELYLAKDANGHISITDVYLYVSGERMSSQARRNYIAGSLSADRGVWDLLLGSESAYIESVPKIEEAAKCLTEEPERALQIIDALPSEVQAMTEILMIRVRAASNLSEDQYGTAMANLFESHPNSASLDLMIIDHYLLRGKFDAALACIDRIDLRVKDPYLDILRGGILLQSGNAEAARKLLMGVAERDPRIEYEALWAIQDLALKTQDHELMLNTLMKLADEYSVEFENLADYEALKAFVASPQYAIWVKRVASAEVSR